MPSDLMRARDWRWSTASPHELAPLRERWRTLARRVGLPAIAGPEWTACFHHAFTDYEGSCLHLLSRGDTLAAVIPLKRQPGVRSRWAAAVHAHVPVWTCAVDVGMPGIGDEILDHLLGSAGALDLEPLSEEDPLFALLVDAARRRGLGVVLTARHPEAIIDLVSPWETFCRTMPGGIKQHMQKLRQLERMGELTFSKVGDNHESPEAVLQECFELEASGWKGTEGVPMRARTDTRAFYQALVREASAAGSLALYTLRLDGRLIAFDLGVQSGRRVDGLKISYDPELGRYSPGSVLAVHVLRREIEEGVVHARHFGPATEWKARWTTHTAPLHALRIHRRGPLARLMYGTAPELRERLRHSARVRAALHATTGAAARVRAWPSRIHGRVRAAALQALLTARWVARRQSVVILRKPLRDLAPVPPHWVLDELGDRPEAVIETYRALGRAVPETWLRRRCDLGQRFFVLRDGDQVLATTFVLAGGERFLDEFAQGLAMPAASFWLRDVYVVPARRGERLFGTLLDAVLARRFPDTRELLSDVRRDDAPSLRAHRRYGFEECGAVESWHLAQRVMWRSSRVPSLRPATDFAPGQRIFATGAAFRHFSESHSA